VTGQIKLRLHLQQTFLFAIMLAGVCFNPVFAQTSENAFSEDDALTLSQAAVGRELADLSFIDVDGNPVSLSDYAGKPLLISMIFTSCHHICPGLTRHLDKAVGAARAALGPDSFQVISVGFDTANDTPRRMAEFAKEQGVSDPNWQFLSGTQESVDELAKNIGFIYFPTPRGFDHLTQLTVVDPSGVIYEQVYGGTFELPWLVEPLKDLVLNRPQSKHNFLSGVVDRVKLFCTVYDPNTGRYKVDYSLFVQIAIGFLVVLAISIYLLVEIRRARKRKRPEAEKSATQKDT
jgi:protein SCO1/2